MKRRALLFFASAGALFFAAFLLNVWVGSAGLSVSEVFSALLGGGTGAAHDIVWVIRLPRLLTAAMLGGALGVSGYLLQTYFRNPIASPFVLGVSSGAKCALAIAMVWAAAGGVALGGALSVLAAFAGALAVTALIVLFASRVRGAATLLVIGVMIGYVCSAVTDLCITFAKEEAIVNLTNWSLGSFAGSDWGDVLVIACFVFPCLAAGLLLAKPIGAFRLGEEYAASMGANVRLCRIALLLLSGLLSAVVVAFAGPVGFVGIAVPHVCKSCLSTSRPALILPASFLAGADFCLLCDLIARTVVSPAELSVGTVTAIFGAPFVIALLLGRKRT